LDINRTSCRFPLPSPPLPRPTKRQLLAYEKLKENCTLIKKIKKKPWFLIKRKKDTGLKISKPCGKERATNG